MSSLELDHYIEQGITVVVATGDINSATAQEFGSYLKDAINQAENGNVILDMSHVYYMSSAGLRDIVSGLKIARRNGGDLHLAGIQGRLKPVFEMVGFDSLSVFYETVDEAVSSFS
ncbi:MAG: STAS domain-containing protein [Phototrophicaceae bacterium]